MGGYLLKSVLPRNENSELGAEVCEGTTFSDWRTSSFSLLMSILRTPGGRCADVVGLGLLFLEFPFWTFPVPW